MYADVIAVSMDLKVPEPTLPKRKFDPKNATEEEILRACCTATA